MEEKLQLKKQIIYPDIFQRLISTMIDLTILSLTVIQIIQLIMIFLFKKIFDEELKLHEINLDYSKGIDLTTTSEQASQFLSTTEVAIFAGISMLTVYVVLGVYFVFMWSKFGTTIGKFIFKSKIVDYKNLGKPSLISLILRYIAYITSPIGMIICLFTKEKRALHDIISKTIVIKQ